MTLLVTIAFFMLAGGCFYILGLTPYTFLEGMAGYFMPKRTSIRSRIAYSKKNKDPKGLKKLLTEVKEILRVTGKSEQFTALCILTMFLFVAGVLVAVTMDNSFLVPILAIGFALAPMYYIKYTAARHRRQVNTELETALSMITTSYLRNKNTVIRAVEENLPYLHPPVSEVFRDFLMQTKLINSNTREALNNLKYGIDNAVFHEWVDAVIACQDDHTLKTTLPPVVNKLSDVRVVSAELDLLLYEPVKEYMTMVLLLVGSVPLLYFLNREWYETLMFTGFGKGILAACCVAVFFSVAAVAKHTSPIEYRR